MKRIGWLVMALVVAFAMPAVSQAQALGYMMQRAQIVEVKEGGVLTVQGEKEKAQVPTQGIRVMDAATGEFVAADKVAWKKGDDIQFFTRTADEQEAAKKPALLVAHPDSKYAVDLDYFAKNGSGAHERLVLLSVPDKVTDLTGQTVPTKYVLGNPLLALYTIATLSLPPQTNPERVWIFGRVTMATPADSADTAKEDADKIDLGTAKTLPDGTQVYALRDALTKAGADIGWNDETRTISVTRDAEVVEIALHPAAEQAQFMANGETSAVDHIVVEDGTTYAPAQVIEDIWRALAPADK